VEKISSTVDGKVFPKYNNVRHAGASTARPIVHLFNRQSLSKIILWLTDLKTSKKKKKTHKRKKSVLTAALV